MSLGKAGRKRHSLPEGDRPITNLAIARTRFIDDWVAEGAGVRGQFHEVVKQVGIRLELPPGQPPLVVPNRPLIGTYLTGAKLRVEKASIFTNTSKMPGPSFAISAGPPAFGGTCPAAGLGEDKAQAKQILQRRLDEQAAERGARPVQLRKLPVVLEGADESRGLVQGVKASYAGDSAFTCRSCLTGDALVMVKDRGLVPIGELVDAGEFVVWSGQGWRTTHAVMQGVRPVVEITTSWGQHLRLTGDHEVLTTEGMLQADEIDPGQRLWMELPESSPWPSNAYLPPQAQAVRASEHHATATTNLPKTWSRGLGIFLGMILGDGSITGGRYPTVSILASKADERDIEALRDLVATWFGTEAMLRTHTPQPSLDNDDLVQVAEPKPQVRISWRLRTLAEFLSALGLDKHEVPIEQRRVPSSIWTASHDGVAGFLAGLFGTDGSITLNGDRKIEVSLASVSRDLLEDVQQLLFGFGIRSTICAYERSNEWRAAEGYRALYKLGINAIDHVRRFARDVQFANERKQSRLEEALARSTTIGREDRPFVVSVEPLGVEVPVYDLMNVGDEHTFVANGFTVSNCYALAGNYVYPSKQVNDMLHLSWIEHELAHGGPERLGTALAYAIQHINLVRAEGFQPYFRIHDAGDFFSEAYLEAWVRCASMMTHMRFWAPTRQWVFQKWVPLLQSAEQRVRAAGGWLVIRPSVLRIGDPIPMLPGIAAGSGVSAEAAEPCVWVCPVYNKLIPKPQPDGSVQYEEAVSCLEANCTACWDQPQVPVSYGAH